MDTGFDYDEVRAVAAEWGYTTHIRSRAEEKHAKVEGQKARRWVVERTLSWLNRYRHLLHVACARPSKARRAGHATST